VVIVTARCTQGDLHLLAVLPDRTKETLRNWIESMPTRLRHKLRTVCTVMWEGDVAAIRAVLWGVALVIDRFHVARHYRNCADTLRKQELKRLRTELPKDTAKQRKRTRWPFRKRPADLADAEKERLAQLFSSIVSRST
jgi:transposase